MEVAKLRGSEVNVGVEKNMKVVAVMRVSGDVRKVWKEILWWVTSGG